jgi:hypothetical protein
MRPQPWRVANDSRRQPDGPPNSNFGDRNLIAIQAANSFTMNLPE